MDVAGGDAPPAELEVESSNGDSLEVLSSKGDGVREIGNPEESLTKIELELAYSSEKLVNFNVLVIHVATRENDFEAFVSEEEPSFGDSAHNAVEFDILSGFLDSEVKVLETFVSSLQNEIARISDEIASCEKLDSCGESLKQSQEQLSEIQVQSATFQRIIRTSGKHDGDVQISRSTSLSDPDTKIKMQTIEHQRHILRLLEKSLAKEMDLEKKLNESNQSLELLNLRFQEERFFAEDEAECVWERLFRAENYSEVLLSTSKELLSRLQVMQFSLNGVTQREESLNARLQNLSALMETKDHKLLEQERIMEEMHNNETKSLREANIKLEKELNYLRSESAHAVASADASMEKQAMLNSTIKDMDNLITTLKAKVSTAESHIEIVEEKCIILSEINAELTEELSFSKGKIEGLEASLHKFEKQKRATTKDITLRTKLIDDLVVQLACERERIHNQIYFLKTGKKLKQNYSQKYQKSNPSTGDDHKEPSKVTKEVDISKKSKNEVTDISGTDSEVVKSSRDISENENVRNIDAWQMNYKYFLLPVFILIITSGVAFWLEYQSERT